MKEVLRRALCVAPTNCTMFLLGETGVGKDVLARFIHSHSKRKGGKFVPFSCAALPESILESELFGHCRGAFTGAFSDRRGLFEEAEDGTIFFDDIADAPPAVQAKLLGAIEEKKIRRLGENAERSVDARVICASNRDLETLVRQGGFRQDLFYRLNAATIEIPPLRERKEDIIPLAIHFLGRYLKEFHKPAFDLPPDVTEAFLSYSWPGNARELRNVAERVAMFAEGSRITLKDVSFMAVRRISAGKSLHDRRHDLEREEIVKAIRNARGNVTKAAKTLGISRWHIYRLARNLGVRLRGMR